MIQLNTTQKLSKKVLSYYFLNSGIFIIFMLAVVFFSPKDKMDPSLIQILKFVIPVLIIAVPIYKYFYWKLFSFVVTEQNITIESGVIFRQKKSVNFNDLQNMGSLFGPLLAVFGLRKVQGFTSSPGQIVINSSGEGKSSSTPMPDVSIILEKDIAEELLNLVQKGDIQKVQSV